MKKKSISKLKTVLGSVACLLALNGLAMAAEKLSAAANASTSSADPGTKVTSSASANAAAATSTSSGAKPSAAASATATPTKDEAASKVTSSAAANTATTSSGEKLSGAALVNVASPQLLVTRVGVSAGSDTVQIYFNQPIEKGDCAYDFKAVISLDSPAAAPLLQLAIAAQLNEKVVQITYDADSASCLSGAPALTFLKMVD